MAELSDLEKFKIIRLLGHPAKTLVEDSTHYSNIIAGRLTNLPEPVVTLIRELLERLENIDEKLAKQIDRAGVQRLDDIVFSGRGIDELRKERRAVLNELSETLDIVNLRGGASANVSICI